MLDRHATRRISELPTRNLLLRAHKAQQIDGVDVDDLDLVPSARRRRKPSEARRRICYQRRSRRLANVDTSR